MRFGVLCLMAVARVSWLLHVSYLPQRVPRGDVYILEGYTDGRPVWDAGQWFPSGAVTVISVHILASHFSLPPLTRLVKFVKSTGTKKGQPFWLPVFDS